MPPEQAVLSVVRRWAQHAERRVYEVRSGRQRRRIERVLGLDLFVPEGVLSPRLFRTGQMLARVAAERLEPGDRLLDLGCGSGVVGLVAAGRGARVVASDLNPDAVRAARVNAMLNRLAVEVVEGDLFERVPDEPRFQLIAFNPPFFQRRQGGALEMALSDGPGLPTLDRFCSECRDHLALGGRVLIAGSTNGALSLMRKIYQTHDLRWRTVAERERLSERLVIDELAP